MPATRIVLKSPFQRPGFEPRQARVLSPSADQTPDTVVYQWFRQARQASSPSLMSYFIHCVLYASFLW